MAVRAARNTGLIISVVIFAALSLLGLGLAIFFYSNLNEARLAANDARTKLNEATAGASDLGAIQAAGKAVEPPLSAVAYLENELARIKRKSVGATTPTVTQAEKQLTDAGAAEGVSALDVIQSLTAERDAAQQQAVDLQVKLDDAGKMVEALNTIKDRIGASAQEQQQKLETDLAQIQKDIESLKASQDEKLATLSTNIETKQKDSEGKLQQAENDRSDLEKRLKEARDRLATFTGSLNRDTPQPPEPIKDVDGLVIAIPASKNIVYINLGKQDHLVLGMTFEVFDAKRGVEVDADGDAKTLKRGKATVEVVSMSDRSAACRVVRSTFGHPIAVSDLIANLVYDKQRTFKFFLFGEFNLDQAGEASLSDTEMVVNLIEEWGGEVVKPEERQRKLAGLKREGGEENLLPFDTDFLVVGEDPAAPAELTEEEQGDDAAQKKRTLAQEKYDRFNRLNAEAQALGIPVLNQNRFLALIGYYQR